MHRVLVFVADAQLFLLLRHVLANEGFDAELATQSTDIEALGGANTIAALVIDWTEASIDRDAILRAARSLVPAARIILLNRNDQRDGLPLPECELVLQRPFDPSLLLQCLRRLRYDRLVMDAATAPENLLRFADLEMNLATVKVVRAGRDVPLTALQFRLLRRLMLEPATVRHRDDLIASCWPGHMEVEPRTVDIHIGHVRRALARSGPDLIRTARGQGYALRFPSDGSDHDKG